MTSLADIRARLEAQENQSKSSAPKSDNAIYPHWNISEGSTATVRFLPDADPDNTFFWVERQVIKLPFNGVKGDPNVKQTIVQVPCVEMFGENCPILSEVRPWFKDASLEDMGRKYWKKRTYLFQGFVRANPLGDDVAPENPIRRFIISPQIIPVIKNGLMDPEIEELPTDYMRGLDFHIKKTSKGQYADYSTSSWARKESALTETEQAAIEAHGLFDLKDFLPKKPSEAELRVIKELFEASVDGKPYDVDKFGAYYRPYGVEAPEGSKRPQESSNSTPSETTTQSNAVPTSTESDAQPEATQDSGETQDTTSDKAADILAMIKARQNG